MSSKRGRERAGVGGGNKDSKKKADKRNLTRFVKLQVLLSFRGTPSSEAGEGRQGPRAAPHRLKAYPLAGVQAGQPLQPRSVRARSPSRLPGLLPIPVGCHGTEPTTLCREKADREQRRGDPPALNRPREALPRAHSPLCTQPTRPRLATEPPTFRK